MKAFLLAFLLTVIFFWTGYISAIIFRNWRSVTKHAWYNPTAWVSSLLFEVALRAPHDIDVIVAAAYGVVEVCGLKRASKPLLAALRQWLRRKVVKHNP